MVDFNPAGTPPYSAGFQYNNPNETPSSIGIQSCIDFWLRQSLFEARKKAVFSRLADTKVQPKHKGKKMKAFHYLPVLDDRNKNMLGLDAEGAFYENGNLYGSSKDVGKILGAAPMLGENGGRVNRVGTTRLSIEGEIYNMGIFTEFSQDALDFDSDPDLLKNILAEVMVACVEMDDDMLQIEILEAANTIVYAGGAVSEEEMTGEGELVSEVTYLDFVQLSQLLNEVRAPKDTKMIHGSAFIDTRTVAACRIMYVGPELLPTLINLTDNFGKPAFIPVHQYAGATTPLEGEIGSVYQFRIIEVPTMKHWAGAGAAVTDEDSVYASTDGKYNVYPMLVPCNGAFSNIGFGSAERGKGKFDQMTKMPGLETADRSDPYGKTGFTSIAWWYGFLAMRPEFIGMIKTVARV